MRALILLSLGLFLSTASASFRFGNDQGNGGDVYALEFVRTGERLVQLMKYDGIKAVDLERLGRAVDHAVVESTEKRLKLKGVRKDAVNFKKKRKMHIVFDRTRWKEMTKGERAALVLHEYLGLIGAEAASYQFSRELSGRFDFGHLHWLDCVFQDNEGGGHVTVGIDETAGLDTILIGIQRAGDQFVASGEAMRPVGEFSQMLLEGHVSLAFSDKYLLSLKASDQEGVLKGHLALNGNAIPIECQIRKIDPKLFEQFDCQSALERKRNKRPCTAPLAPENPADSGAES
jgi:hypothetical protein